MRKIFFTGMLFTAFGAQAQQNSPVWVSNFGGPGTIFPRTITIDAQQNVYTTGAFDGSVDFDPGPGVLNLVPSEYVNAYVSKLDAAGDLLWAHTFATGVGTKITTAPSPDGGVYISGEFRGTCDLDPGSGVFNLYNSKPADWDAFILKLDASGNFEWVRQIEGSAGSSIDDLCTDAAGNIYAAGFFDGSADFNPAQNIAETLTAELLSSAFFWKLSPQGDFLSASKIDGVITHATSIAVDASGNLYASGIFTGTVDCDPGPGEMKLSGNDFGNTFLVKLDPAGQLVWGQKLTGESGVAAYDLKLDANGNIYIGGNFSRTVDFNPGSGIFELFAEAAPFLLKLDTDGNFKWAKKMGGSLYYALSGQDFMTVDPSGNVYVSTAFSNIDDFNPGAGEYHLISEIAHQDDPNDPLTISYSTEGALTKLDAAGEFVWARKINYPGAEVAVNASGNIYMLGRFAGVADFDGGSGVYEMSSIGQTDAYVLKMSNLPEETMPANGIRMYPNPTKSLVNVYVPQPTAPGIDILVYNYLGVLVGRQTTYSELNTVDLTGLTMGIYLIKVANHNDILTTQRVMKID